MNPNIFCKDTYKLFKILEKYNITIDNVNITKNKFFMKLYNKIKLILKSINISNNIKINILKNIDINEYLYDDQFTSKEIKTYIKINLKYAYELTFENNKIIYFAKKAITSEPNKIIIHMFTIIKLLKELFNRDNSQKVIYFETNQKKKFPKKNKTILGPNEINSGLTSIDLHKNGDIILFRREEVLKVLIHELIHSNLVDSKLIFSKQLKTFSNLFCVNYNILLNEAFTESFATLINLFYLNIINNLTIFELDIMFYNEICYSTYICSKIMKYYKIINIGDVIKETADDVNKCANNFPQKTNVFAYYILKNILLTNHILFGNILNIYTINYKIKNEEGINKIIELITDNIHKLKTIDIIDKNNSLRLCLYEINEM